MKYPKEDNNEGLIYGIEYMDGEEVSDVEWFATAKERDAELKSYIEEFGADNMTVRSQIVRKKDKNDNSINLDESDKEKLEDELEDMKIADQKTTIGNLHVSRIRGVDIHDAETLGAESKFDKLAKEIASDYRKKGKSPEKALEIGEATAAKIGRAKYGKKKFSRMGKKAENFYQRFNSCFRIRCYRSHSLYYFS